MHLNDDLSMDDITLQGKEKLLHFLGMDLHFEDGSGDWLNYTNSDGEKISVLDVTGSYGINSLGHKNQILQEEFIDFIKKGPPAFVQASFNPEKRKLIQKVSSLLGQETGSTNWIAEFANTGTEIIEAALKMAVLNYNERLEEIRQEINRSINGLPRGKEELRTTLEQGRRALETDLYVLHLENSFHGKTLGALSAMGNSTFRAEFPTAFRTCRLPKKVELIPPILEEIQQYYFVYDDRANTLVSKTFLPVAAMLIEPVQGEAGVHIQSQELIDFLFNLREKHQFPIISDEIQCGLFRCGTFAALSLYDQCADIYCFGKALGGGIVKNSMLLANSSRFEEHFFKYHSSSFGEDAYSMHMSLCALDLLEEYNNTGSSVLPQIIELKISNPEVIKDVRGIGHMWAIEFDVKFLNTSFIRKYLKDIDLLGYWISSALLFQERIRILPTLSGPLTFRIQPSFVFGQKEMDHLMTGLNNLIQALQSGDTNYLFSHIVPKSGVQAEKNLSEAVSSGEFPKDAAVFLCHPVDIPHFRRIVDMLEGYDDLVVSSLINEMRAFQKYSPYHVCKIGNSDGKQIDVVFLGIPYTSHQFYLDLRNGKRSQTVKVIQDAIDLANAHGAKVIGLGQYTSIITENGLSLRSDAARLTTGNSYTAQSTLDALCMAAEIQGLELSLANIGVIGAAGNIISVITDALIRKVGHLSLIFNGDPLKSKRNREVIRNILLNIDPSLEQFNLLDADVLRMVLKNDAIATYCSVHADLTGLNTCDVVICGANSSQPILFPEHLKTGAIIVDLAVPGNADDTVVSSVNYTYLKGGIIDLPQINGQTQALNSVIFPFEAGESFACMAETIALAFEEKTDNDFFGPLTLAKLQEIKKIMEKNGFKVKRLKVKDSL